MHANLANCAHLDSHLCRASIEDPKKKHEQDVAPTSERAMGKRSGRGLTADASKAAKKARRAAAVAERARAALDEAKAELTRVRSLFSTHFRREQTFTCVDVEAWERDSKRVTEIGVVSLRLGASAVKEARGTPGPAPPPVDGAGLFFYDRGAGVPVSTAAAAAPSARSGASISSGRSAEWECRHFVIKENLACRNGRFVADNRDSFLFGTSEILPRSAAASLLASILERSDYLVGHDLRGDVEWLRSMGVAVERGRGSAGGGAMGSVNLASKHRQIDTQHLAHAITGSSTGLGLKRLLLDHFEPIAPVGWRDEKLLKLHNGGNDAAWTMALLLSLAKDGAGSVVAPPAPVRAEGKKKKKNAAASPAGGKGKRKGGGGRGGRGPSMGKGKGGRPAKHGGGGGRGDGRRGGGGGGDGRRRSGGSSGGGGGGGQRGGGGGKGGPNKSKKRWGQQKRRRAQEQGRSK